MQVNIQELLDSADLKDPVYPGKKLVKKYAVPGAYKSHCVVFDWRKDDVLHVALKAGQSGRDLDIKELKQYPVSFQAPTYLDIAFNSQNDNEVTDEDEDEDEESKGKKGKKGGGSKGIKSNVSLSAFEKVTEGQIPGLGEIEKFVVMGKEIAKEAYGVALDNLKEQLSQAKVMVMDLMKDVDDTIKRATPGGGLEAKGNEALNYKYDIEKNGPMFGAMGPS
ncbi:MAG: hypothetical protein AAF569_01770 [Pseudomonadota bacterium]